MLSFERERKGPNAKNDAVQSSSFFLLSIYHLGLFFVLMTQFLRPTVFAIDFKYREIISNSIWKINLFCFVFDSPIQIRTPKCDDSTHWVVCVIWVHHQLEIECEWMVVSISFEKERGKKMRKNISYVLIEILIFVL